MKQQPSLEIIYFEKETEEEERIPSEMISSVSNEYFSACQETHLKKTNTAF